MEAIDLEGMSEESKKALFRKTGIDQSVLKNIQGGEELFNYEEEQVMSNPYAPILDKLVEDLLIELKSSKISIHNFDKNQMQALYCYLESLISKEEK